MPGIRLRPTPSNTGRSHWLSISSLTPPAGGWTAPPRSLPPSSTAGISIRPVEPRHFGRISIWPRRIRIFTCLGSSQKPRSQGLMRHENLVPGGILALYPFAPSDTLTGQDIAGSRTGSTFFERGSPFTARVAATRISSGSGLVTSDAGRSRQVLLGVVNVERNHANVRVRAGDHSTTATLTPGLNWILLAPTPVPFDAPYRAGGRSDDSGFRGAGV